MDDRPHSPPPHDRDMPQPPPRRAHLAGHREIRVATMNDLPFIDQLQKKFSNHVGFMPAPALESYVSKNCVRIASVDGAPVAYILGRLSLHWQPLIRPIYQLCVEPAAHAQYHASLLLDTWEAEATASGQAATQANCAATIPAHTFWPSQGYCFTCVLDPKNQRGREIIVWRKLLVRRVKRWFIDPPHRAGHRGKKTGAST